MIQALISGLLLGGVYGLFSMGFSLAFGVMRIINFAHGAMVMIAMYLVFYAYTLLGIDPLWMVLLAPVAIAALGSVVYVGVYRRFVGRTTLQQLLAAIALGLVLQSLAELAFSPETRALRNSWGSHYILVGGVFLSYAQAIAFAVAVICVALVELVLRFTRWGQAIRAVADDAEAAEIVGQNAQAINLGAFGLATGLAGVAGTVLVTYYPFNPVVGFSLMPIALIATVLGGLGSVGGAFLGGIICGIVQQMTSALWAPALQDLPLYGLLLVFLAFRPYGLFGRRAAH
ncbi:MAG: branched-chain amino acid ABC transporter permease [Rhodospirillales bacterium]|nr:branched-chain amino acid ABC transporter permease [Rhodospirillales bacterium]